MEKYLTVEFSDRTKWKINARIIAENRARYYCRDQIKDEFEEEIESTLNDEFEIEDWAKNNMDWCDVDACATRIKDEKMVDYNEEWCNAEMEVIEG